MRQTVRTPLSRLGFWLLLTATLWHGAAILYAQEGDSQFLAHLAAANSALRLNESSEARRWLDEIPETHRGWEWKLLDSRADSSKQQIATGEWSPVRLDISSDGGRLAVAGSDGLVRLYDAQTLGQISEWKVSEQAVYAARISPDGKHVAACARDGQLSVWDIESQRQVWSKKNGGEGLADTVYSPDGNQLLFCSWFRGDKSVLGTVSTWDSASGMQKWKTEFGVKPVVAARFSKDGQYFAVGTWDAQVGVWNTETLTDPQVFDFKDRSQYSAIDDIAFSPDSRQIAAATKNGAPRIWTLDGSAPPVDLIGHLNAVFSIAYSNDGKSLLTGGSDGVLAVWDVSQRVQTHRFMGHTNRIGSIALPESGNRILTASADRSIRAWDLSSTRGFESAEAGKYVYGMVLANHGQLLVTAGQTETNITVWDAKSRSAVRHFPGTDGTINFLAGDGKNLVAGGNWASDVCLWDIETGAIVQKMHKESGGLQQCALSSDAQWLASATNKKQVVVWNAQTGETARVISMTDGCWGIEFSNDGEALVVGDGLGTIHWISTTSWETQWTCLAGSSQVNAIRISPTGTWLAVGTEGGILSIIDVESRKLRYQVQAHSERIWSVDVSPDGKRVATASSDLRVKLWDPATGKSTLTLADFSDPIYNVRYSADGQSLFVNCLGARIIKVSAE